ncbi:MAG TPA: pyridoxal-phosphate dependent enzyme [Kofleriaceae bacterium]|nr:pyridoxal-phosphate dependent enzyme [Kofleriaceae bacterium]
MQNASALARYLPRIAAKIAWAPLGDWPTPISELQIDGAPLWVKREGDSSALYGGNKVRTLEAWLGHTRASGARRIWSIGAYGSNHVVATVLHAKRLGLEAAAIVFPQPASEWAIENAGALIATGVPIVRLRTVIEVPFAGIAIAARAKWGKLIAELAAQSPASRDLLSALVGDELARDSIVMPPGGATPIGTLGALSAVFELLEQVDAGVMPPPRRIVLPVGSTCTTAGLVSGLALAHAIGAWRWPVPVVHAVRVTPWPVTSRVVILRLAEATLARIASLGGPRITLSQPRLVVDREEFGGGYGRITDRGREAIARFASLEDAPRLDGVYSAKAAAALLRLHHEKRGPLLFWATKSSTLMQPPASNALRSAPRALARWLDAPT